jgi:hypothetical protein
MVVIEQELLYMTGYIDTKEEFELEMQELKLKPPFRGAMPIESLGVLWPIPGFPRTGPGWPGAAFDYSVGRHGIILSEDNINGDD